MKPVHAAIAALALMLAPAASFAQAPGADPIINYGDNDAAMNKAIADARAHLGYFWQRVEAKQRNETDFGLKVAFPVKMENNRPSREHIWVERFARSGAGFTAYLANEPGWMPGKKLGDRVEFTEDMITDWGFYRSGKLIGFYTVRVMLPDMPASEAAEIRAQLGENPK
jgi:uncharacterized protein YegJ (DUF2314 family)